MIVEHFRDKVMGLLGGHAKAMVVTGSRKEAVRYKLGFDRYVKEKGYSDCFAMVAFSGEVMFDASDPNVEGLLGEKFTETSTKMNPDLKGREANSQSGLPIGTVEENDADAVTWCCMTEAGTK